MNRPLALLAGLLMIGQVAAQPAAATELHAASDPVVHQATAPSSDDIDVKVELIRGWWEGSARHSQFKVTNTGETAIQVNRIGKNARVVIRIDYVTEESQATESESTESPLGDLAPGEGRELSVICKPKPGLVCAANVLTAISPSDRNDTNNTASDRP
jgi:hypothetical protein